MHGKADSVYNVYIVPDAFITKPASGGDAQYPGDTQPKTATKHVAIQQTLDGYTPKNKKVLCYPYNYLVLSNNNGSSNILHYERFTEWPYDPDYVDFKIKGVPVVGASIKCIPNWYDNIEANEDEGIIAGKLPTLNWAKDEYTNWLTQNSVNIGMGIASQGMQIVGGLANPEPVSGTSQIISGAMGIASILNEKYIHSLQPNSARGSVNGGDINVCSDCNGFYFYRKSIKQEYAKIIDDYFTMFGYKVNTLKVPNITGRQNWNYIKTVDCNVDGDIPQTDLNIIKAMFNNGVTLWHNPATMYNYSNTNNIVT